MTVPFAFANLSGNIALAKLDSNFNTPITIGNTSVLLGNTITTINNVTLANVTISSGTASNISLTSPLAVSSGGTGSANLTVNNVLIGNGTSAVTSVAPGTTGNVLTSIGGAWVSNVALTSAAAGANTQVQYNSANLLAGSANLTFDGTNLGLAGGTANGVSYLNGSKVLTTGSALTFDGTNLGIGGTPTSFGSYRFLTIQGANTANGGALELRNSNNTLNGQIYVGSSTMVISATSNVPMLFNTNGTERMRLDVSGNLGLGVTPSAWDTGSSVKALQVGSAASLWSYLTTSAYVGANEYWNGANRIYLNTAPACEYGQENGVHIWKIAPSGTAGNAITFTQAMTLNASGALFVGATALGSNANYFAYDPGNTFADFGHATGVASGISYTRFLYAGGVIGSITQSGTTAVLYNVTSDQRLKENIVDAPEFGSVIDALQVRSYDWKSDGNHQRAGFVAQELVTVAPEAVHQPADPDEMMAVDYSKLVPMLVKEIQSLRIRIAQLEAK